jgi:FkbH-like protein
MSPATPVFSEIKQIIPTDPVKALAALAQHFDPTWDFSTQQQAYRIFKQLQTAFADQCPEGFKELRVAVGGTTTLTQLTWLLSLNLLSAGFYPHIYETNYSTFRQEMMNPASELYQFRPQVLLILTGGRDVLAKPDMAQDAAQVHALIEQEFASWSSLWETFYQHTGCTIIQNNFDLPDTRPFGHYELQLPGSLTYYLMHLNLHLATHKPEYVILHDLEALTAYYGKVHWNDPRFFHHSKQACSFDCLPAYAESLASIIRARFGLGRKCLVLDLDNTLWGGIVGDDGVAGLEIGEGTPVGEAHLTLQQYARSLKERGILLAVCSKNELENAQAPFSEIPDMALKLDDFASFVANWEPKSENLRRIARELNIGLDSLVFIDDNPAERAIVRQFLPEVAVPELPDDPALYVRAIEARHYFEPLAFSDEDRQRTRFYLEDRERNSLAQSVTNMQDFLGQLDMVATIQPFNEVDLDRIAQLVARSNQFNLTTQRYSRAQLSDFMNDPAYVTRSVRLQDRFGDNGLIAVWLGKMNGTTLTIDTWLMSCRVLMRGVEQHLLNHVIEHARANGVTRIEGCYIPTKKNKLVEEHYAKLGFTLVTTQPDKTTVWEMLIDATTLLPLTQIRDNAQ